MKVSRIHLVGVTTHLDTTLELPDAGVVLIGGANGSGKSTILEAVPLALWGKSLRKSDLWSAKVKKAKVSVVVDGTEYTRTSYGRVKLAWGTETFESTTSAQKVLDTKIGTLEHWRRSCVLSSADASTFTGATDAERKRLLEALTGGERFDAAHAAALQVHGRCKAALSQATRQVDVLRERVRGAERAVLSIASTSIAVEDVPSPDLQRLGVLKAAEREVEKDISALRQTMRQVESNRARAAAAVEQARREAERFSRSECPTCGQPIGDHLRAAAQERVEQAKAAAVDDPEPTDTPSYEDLAARQAKIRREINDIQRAEAAWASMARAREQAAKLAGEHAQALHRLEAAKSDLLAADQASLDADVAEREAAAVVRALSTKGVRAHLLANVIAAVEQSANSWLARICDDRLHLVLRPYSETDSGSTKEAVALSIEFEDDASRGYASASGGERRRIDVALCFALAEVADAYGGQEGSTIFADEIFDALDVDGRQRVATALQELAEDRCVVVIAHEAGAQLAAVAKQNWQVDRGSLVRVG